MKRKTKAEILSEKPLEEISKMMKPENIAQLRKDLTILRAGYRRRIGSFERKGLSSYAQIALERSIPEGSLRDIKKMSPNQLVLEYARYSKFFRDVTSNEKGIRDVNRMQDIRIFGADNRGNPLRTMTPEERESFWELYDEFKKQYKEDFSKYQSGRVMSMLGTMEFENGADSPDFLEQLNKLKEKLESEYQSRDRRSAQSVRRGRRNNR